MYIRVEFFHFYFCVLLGGLFSSMKHHVHENCLNLLYLQISIVKIEY